MLGFLDQDDIKLLQESLRYSKIQIEEYSYPSEGIRREKIARIDEVSEKLKYLKEELDAEQ